MVHDNDRPEEKEKQEPGGRGEVVLPFRSGSPMIVAGPTNSGKTFWVQRLLQNADKMFDRVPKSVLYCYSVYQPTYEMMKAKSPMPIQFSEGVPNQKQFDAMDDDEFHVVVLDDLMERIVNSKEMSELFSIYCHHKHFSAILITQNIFVQGSQSRNISLNAHVFVLFANKRDEQQIHRLGRQFYPAEWRSFVRAYKDATEKPFSHLVVDVTPAHPRIVQLRSNIFPGEYPIVYSIC